MNEISLSDRVEVAITALQDIGDGTWDDLHPSPEKMTHIEIHSIVQAHVLTVAKLQIWIDVLAGIPEADHTDREVILQNLLDRRIQECSSILMSLLGQAN